jgi:hypothetical protein
MYNFTGINITMSEPQIRWLLTQLLGLVHVKLIVYYMALCTFLITHAVSSDQNSE